MRWEDLINDGGKTIFTISQKAVLPISESAAHTIWENMKFKNQTAHHRHNFRKGVVNDWENNMINEHLEIIKERGMEKYMQALGYGKIKYQDKKNYTPFQKQVEKYINAGKIYEEFDDPDLFMFAFNKSNFRSSKYDFVSYTNGGLVEVERSSIKNELLLKGFLDAIEEKLRTINESIKVIYQKYL
jgi:hypothetical protein